METKAIKDVFGEYARRVPVTAIKSMIGEPLSASGALICAAAVESLYHGIIPPTVNYKEKDPDCDLDYVIDVPREKDIRNALVISSDPYGNNSAIVLGKYSKDEG
jgi:3-oxoacyl-[acyl-carrier-protein] synthase II